MIVTLLRKTWWQLILIGIAVYVGIRYTGNWKKKPSSPVTPTSARKADEIKLTILKKSRRLMKTYCEPSSDSCLIVEDRPTLSNDKLTVRRALLYKDYDQMSVSSVDLETPEVLTWKNFNSRNWPINKKSINSPAFELIAELGFVMEALEVEPQEWQDVLMIGLGGGALSNYFSSVDSIKVNLTAVELNPLMKTIAKEWFGLQETPNYKVFIEDGVKFLEGAVQRGEKYKMIILDACDDVKQSLICPGKEFMKPSVIQDIIKVLDSDGALIVNILCSRDNLANEDKVLLMYKDHFTSCFHVRYSEAQRLVACSHRKNWSILDQMKRFEENIKAVESRLNFDMGRIIWKFNP
ncbi:hypothetical protein V3C99_018760 [Haemonchus contortus]